METVEVCRIGYRVLVWRVDKVGLFAVARYAAMHGGVLVLRGMNVGGQ